MTTLTPDDVNRWDVSAIQQVFDIATDRGKTLDRLGQNLDEVDRLLATWQGEGGDAFRDELGKTRHDIQHDNQETAQVAKAVSQAKSEIQACKKGLESVEQTAQANGWKVTSDWKIDIGNTGIGHENDPAFAKLRQQLQSDLDRLKIAANAADRQLATALRAAVGDVEFDQAGNPRAPGSPQNGFPGEPSADARMRDVMTLADPKADPLARQLAQERLNDLTMSQFVGPLQTDPIMGGDARTRAQGRMEMQQLMESDGIPGRGPLTPDQATALIDKWEAQGRQMVLNGFAAQLQRAGVSGPGIQRALGEIQSGKSPGQVIHDAASGIADWGGALGGGAEAHGGALPNGRHWGDRPVWSKADAEALEGFGRKLTVAGIGLDSILTINDIANGEPAGPALTRLGGRALGGWAGGALAGALWGSAVGPEGTLIVGLLGALAGAVGGDELVKAAWGE